MQETAMASAMKKAGMFSPQGVELLRAVAKYFNNGGTVREFERICSESIARLLSGEGHRERATNGQATPANPRQPVKADGAVPIVPEQGLGKIAPPPSLNADAAGRMERACYGQQLVARPSAPPQSRVSIDAAKSVRKVVAKTVMHTMEVRGRGPWAHIAVGELRAIQTECTRDASIARQLLRLMPAGTSTAATVEEVIELRDFQRAVQSASEAVEAALAGV